MPRQFYIYILTNKLNTVLYIGVTSDLYGRVFQHKAHSIDGFTKRYNIDKLVYYEIFENVTDAILREKQIKGGSRKKELDLVNSMNPEWNDLFLDMDSQY